MKFERCDNALECYRKLRSDLTKKGSSEQNKKWSEWEKDGNEKLLKKTPLTTNRTFIGLGLESMEDLHSLQQQGYDHIVFTDQNNVLDMKAIKDTQKIYQLQAQGDDMICSALPCSCPPCRSYPSDHNECEYKEERKMRTQKVSKKNIVQDEIEEDKYEYSALTVTELRRKCKTYNLPVSGKKADIVASLNAFEENSEEYFDEMYDDDEWCETALMSNFVQSRCVDVGFM